MAAQKLTAPVGEAKWLSHIQMEDSAGGSCTPLPGVTPGRGLWPLLCGPLAAHSGHSVLGEVLPCQLCLIPQPFSLWPFFQVRAIIREHCLLTAPRCPVVVPVLMGLLPPVQANPLGPGRELRCLESSWNVIYDELEGWP